VTLTRMVLVVAEKAGCPVLSVHGGVIICRWRCRQR
jgi:hypothetical protein